MQSIAVSTLRYVCGHSCLRYAQPKRITEARLRI
jgi:hypothetical protein